MSNVAGCGADFTQEGVDDDEYEADENNDFSVGNVENADAESGSRRSGRTERKRYSDPGEEDDDVY